MVHLRVVHFTVIHARVIVSGAGGRCGKRYGGCRNAERCTAGEWF
jgi:hypothetical protein